MASLAEELAKLANPSPHILDPEDDNDLTKAKLFEKSSEIQDENVDVSGTHLTRKSALLLSDIDRKYSGKKSSRRDIFQDSESQENEDADGVDQDLMNLVFLNGEDEENGDDDADDDEDDNEDDNEDVMQDESDEETNTIKTYDSKIKKATPLKKDASFVYEDDGDFGQYAGLEDGSDSGSDDDDSDIGDDDDDDDDTDDKDSDDVSRGEPVEEDGVRKFSQRNVTAEVEQGNAAKNQLSLWDSMLKIRIELQKLLVIVNRLPQPDVRSKFMEQGSEAFKNAADQGNASLKCLLDHMVQLQTLLLLQNPQTKHVVEGGGKMEKQKNKQKAVLDDEEITSESEKEDDKEAEEEHQEKLKKKTVIKRKMSSYPELLAKRHKGFESYRNDAIQKWYDKTKIASGKLGKGFSAFEQSALKQIDQILGDQSRLVRRSQLKRSGYHILGKVESQETAPEPEDYSDQVVLPNRDHLKTYDEEIFDDDDFYHQLLRELIERKSNDLNDPVAMTRQWLEIQKLKTKVKKNVDTKASKGRKIRYQIHPKLVNFMAPIPENNWTDDAKNDLFSSLFGQRQPKSL